MISKISSFVGSLWEMILLHYFFIEHLANWRPVESVGLMNLGFTPHTWIAKMLHLLSRWIVSILLHWWHLFSQFEIWGYSSILHWEKTSEGSAQVANSGFTRRGHWRVWQKFLVVKVKTFHESPTSRYMWLIFDTFEYPNGFVSTMRHGTSSKIHGFHNEVELFGRPLVSHWFLDIPKYPGKHCIYIYIYTYSAGIAEIIPWRPCKEKGYRYVHTSHHPYLTGCHFTSARNQSNPQHMVLYSFRFPLLDKQASECMVVIKKTNSFPVSVFPISEFNHLKWTFLFLKCPQSSFSDHEM